MLPVTGSTFHADHPPVVLHSGEEGLEDSPNHGIPPQSGVWRVPFPETWEIAQAIFERTLFSGELEWMQTLSYQDLEKQTVMTVQHVFPI